MSEDTIYFGEVCWFSGTYGFIAWQRDNTQQNDIFVHYSDIASEGFRTLYKGQKVSFCIGKNKQGIDKAINVKVLQN
jgi:cold shock protein